MVACTHTVSLEVCTVPRVLHHPPCWGISQGLFGTPYSQVCMTEGDVTSSGWSCVVYCVSPTMVIVMSYTVQVAS